MKLPRNYCELLGFDAIVHKDKETVYVTNIETGETQAVSTSSDIEYIPPTFQDVADVIANRIASSVSRDTAIDLFVTTLSDQRSSDECPTCGI